MPVWQPCDMKGAYQMGGIMWLRGGVKKGLLLGTPSRTKSSVFSVTRRSRSDGSHSLTHSLSESLTEWLLADLTDVTLASDDTYEDDEEDEEDEMMKKLKKMKKMKKMSKM